MAPGGLYSSGWGHGFLTRARTMLLLPGDHTLRCTGVEGWSAGRQGVSRGSPRSTLCSCASVSFSIKHGEQQHIRLRVVRFE